MYQAVAYQRRNNTVHIWDDVKGHLKIKYGILIKKLQDYTNQILILK